jgi:hypothetical protein
VKSLYKESYKIPNEEIKEGMKIEGPSMFIDQQN